MYIYIFQNYVRQKLRLILVSELTMSIRWAILVIVEIDVANLQPHYLKNRVTCLIGTKLQSRYVKNYVLIGFRICNVIMYFASVYRGEEKH